MSDAAKNLTETEPRQLDAVVIGAGFAGLCSLYKFREVLCFDVQVYETGDGVGGTWYWNRYPGARCDSESFYYCFSFDDELANVATGMLARMHASNGVGLAAPQVGLRRRLLVMNPSGEEGDDHVLVNPELLERAGDEAMYEEGCLSFPGVYAEIRRSDRCKVRFFSVEGVEQEEEFSGFPSRVVQHEFDHLEGVLLVDRMSPADKVRNKHVLQDLVARYQERCKREESTA